MKNKHDMQSLEDHLKSYNDAAKFLLTLQMPSELSLEYGDSIKENCWSLQEHILSKYELKLFLEWFNNIDYMLVKESYYDKNNTCILREVLYEYAEEEEDLEELHGELFAAPVSPRYTFHYQDALYVSISAITLLAFAEDGWNIKERLL